MTNDQVPEQETALVVNFLQFVGAGWHTTGDALLAKAAADLARGRHDQHGPESCEAIAVRQFHSGQTVLTQETSQTNERRGRADTRPDDDVATIYSGGVTK